MNTNKFQTCSELIKQADYVLIGAGAGMSASGGLDYTNKQVFKELYPEFLACGCKTIFEAIGAFWDLTEENARSFWGFWATHIKNIRYDSLALKPYLDLHKILANKNHFIITTNVDGQFIKADFDQSKIFAPQGNYGFFQCKECDEIFDNKEMIENMVSHMDHLLIRKEDIPYCPNCGGLLDTNLRKDHSFVEKPHMANYQVYKEFVENSFDGQLVILELGVGFNTPSIIRYPFEKLAVQHPNATLIRFNIEQLKVDEKLSRKMITIHEDITFALEQLRN